MRRVQKQKPRNLCIKSKKDWTSEEKRKPKKVVPYNRKPKHKQFDIYDDEYL